MALKCLLFWGLFLLLAGEADLHMFLYILVNSWPVIPHDLDISFECSIVSSKSAVMSLTQGFLLRFLWQEQHSLGIIVVLEPELD
jgi:hypothetical protein